MFNQKTLYIPFI